MKENFKSSDYPGLMYLNSASADDEIKRHQVGEERYRIIQKFQNGDLKREEAMAILEVSRSRFYKLVKRATGTLNYIALVPEPKGRKVGANAIRSDVLKLIEEMFNENFQKAKTYSAVWQACQAEADLRCIPRPSYHTVKRWIKKQPEKLLYRMQYGADAAAQKFQLRDGYKSTSRLLEWVQIDHTSMDMQVVDENDRNTLLGRPYISFAICLYSRVIIGMYISLLSPSAVTVAMLLESCVLPKDELLEKFGFSSNIWPMHGLPETIHADNAKEFVSDVFSLNAIEFGIRIEHRLPGRKYEGGHIESLIGKWMRYKIHRLMGSTGSNTVDRKKYDSEGTAGITIQALRKMTVLAINQYHETVHSSLGRRPVEVWNETKMPRILDADQQERFKYYFYPEKEKKISPSGISMFRREYSSPVIRKKVGDKVLVKYDPYDIGYIMIQDEGRWQRIPCVRNSFNRSDDYEIYRGQRQNKGERQGTMSRSGANSSIELKKLESSERSLTKKDKANGKRKAGMDDYREMNKDSGNSKSTAKNAESTHAELMAKHKSRPLKKKDAANISSYLQNMDQSSGDIDDIVIYDSTPSRWKM